MTTVHLVHGYNVTDDGRGTTGALVPYWAARGYRTRERRYGWKGLLGVRFANPRIAGDIAREVRPGDIGCGHSNGCAILAEAADYGAPFGGLVLINPALDPDRDFAPQLRWVHVYHNSGDLPVLAAELLDWLPWNWRGGHPWGRMGNTGYTGADERVRNFNGGQFDPPLSCHSDIFEALEIWGPRLVNVAAIDHLRTYRQRPGQRGHAAG